MSLLFLFGTSLAHADPISFTFATTLTKVTDSASSVLGVELQPGEFFIGSVSYELAGPDQSDDPRTAIFPATGSISLPFVRVPMQFVQVILSEANPQLGDFVGFAGRDPRTFPGPFEELFSVVAFVDPSGQLLTTTDVPDVSLLPRFPGGPGQAFTITTDTPFTSLVEGTMNAVSEPVPEPATMLLVAIGAARLACSRWDTRRRGLRRHQLPEARASA
jgi:hypothetical protein